MTLQIESLTASFKTIEPQADEFASSFYNTLFTTHPEVKPLFASTNMAKQKQMLLSALTFVIKNLRAPEALHEGLKSLGARHVQYGTLEQHYTPVGEALLTTFATYLGNEWTPELKQAWTDAYGIIVEIMLEGAREVSS